MIATLASFGVESGRAEGYTGVWVKNEKIAAIGVKVSRWITMHGFALNVSTDLSFFDRIIPCGIFHKGVTTLDRILPLGVEMDVVKSAFIHHFAELFRMNVTQWPRTELELSLTVVAANEA